MRLGQANGGAQRCGCRSIRQEALDSLVLGDVIARVLEPERLRELLSRVLEVPSENSTRGPETLEYETPAEHFEACVAMTD